MPRVPPKPPTTPSALKPRANKSATGRTRNGRVAKPYKVTKKSTLEEILAEDVFINRATGWIKNDTSRLKKAGHGAFADRTFEKNELIGRFQGSPVYELEIEGKIVCFFKVKFRQVHFMSNISHVIWSGQTTKQLDLATASPKEPRVLNLNYGIEVDGRMSKINYHQKKDNVVAKTFYDETHICGTSADGRILIHPSVSFQHCLAIALYAKKKIPAGTEMYLNYMPDTDDSLNFETMDNLPIPSLTPEEQTALQIAVDNIEPESKAPDMEQDLPEVADTDSDPGISLQLPSDSSNELTPTPSELEESQTVDTEEPEPLAKTKSNRWFGNCNIQ